MASLKATQYLHNLEAARCQGNWDQVPEWSRKVQKHAPGRKCLALTAVTESKLLHIHPPPPGAPEAAFQTYSAALQALLDTLQQELDSHTLPLPPPSPPLSAGDESAIVTDSDILQARVVIAWIWSLKGEWDEVLDIVPGENEAGEGWVSGSGKTEYTDTMRMKALVLRGLALSHTTSDHSLPLQLYRSATRLHASFAPSNVISPVRIVWAEKALALYALATYRVWSEEHARAATPEPLTAPSTPGEGDGDSEGIPSSDEEGPVGVAIGNTIVDESTVASAFRAFHSFVAGIAARPNADILKKRTEAYRDYFKFLSFLLLPPGHPNRPVAIDRTASGREAVSKAVTAALSRKLGASKAGSPERLREELKTISKIYENHFLTVLKFPKAEEYHEEVGEWADQVVENWRVAGGSAEEAAPVVEILYRASKKSFHSPRILRHLFYTLTITGNFQDALAALNSYLDLIQRAMDRIAKGNVEKDMDSLKLIFQTAVEGIRVMCKFTPNGLKAMDIASKMEKWIEQWRVKDKEILAEVYRGMGIANATFARKTAEGELRPGAQQAAVDAFRKGLGYDSRDIQSWYGLALMQAEMRATDNAIESTRKGLGALKYTFLDNEFPVDEDGNARDYKRFAVPLLHLLALLMTSKEDFDSAEKVCKNAFDIVGEGREAVSDLGVSDKVAIFELMMTQLAIVEATEDSEAAAAMAEQLLALYSVLFDGSHLVQRQQTGDSTDTMGGGGGAAGDDHGIDIISSPSRPGTTASRRSRLFGRSHKKQFSASSNSLPGQALDAPNSPPSQTGILRNRPKTGTGDHPSISSMPKIQVTDAHGQGSSAQSSEKSHRKLMRPSSVSGGTVRRMRSLSSLRLRHEPKQEEPPTPPLPTSTEASSLYFDSPSGSVREGKDPYLFQTLKNKLHYHVLKHSQSASAVGSFTSIAETLQADGTPAPPQTANTTRGRESRSGSLTAESVQNVPPHKRPYPLGALGQAEDPQDSGQARSPRRPAVQLPEPKLAVDDEQKQVLGALRKGWLCVAGLYRRAGYFNDAIMAIEEAASLIGKEGEGEADVLAERGSLAVSQYRRALAAELFEAAISLDHDHPASIVGLSKLLLNVKDMDEPESDTDDPPSASNTRVCMGCAEDADVDEEAEGNRIAAQNRALGLLEKLVVSQRGWDLPDGWFLLADALEKAGEEERAKCALWRVVGLEDGVGVRGWRSCGAGVV